MASSTSGKPISVGIIGGTGYTGAELLNFLLRHPVFEPVAVSARQRAGDLVSDHWTHLAGLTELTFVEPSPENFAACELVFCATPHAAAMAVVPDLLAAGARVVDLSADFRLKDIPLWERWYGVAHTAPAWAEKAVYGLTEWTRDAVAEAQLVANPGCYPTATLLALGPLAEAGLISDPRIIADAKSGVSGAGRKASESLLYGAIAENFAPYGLAGHRHAPEILQGLSMAGLAGADLTFVPHLVPMFRGMEVTAYFDTDADGAALTAAAVKRYAKEPFVSVLEGGAVPDTQSVRGSNRCRLAYFRVGPSRGVAVSVIDNLGKGAAGQAIQNANVMFGLAETTGLDVVPAAP